MQEWSLSEPSTGGSDSETFWSASRHSSCNFLELSFVIDFVWVFFEWLLHRCWEIKEKKTDPGGQQRSNWLINVLLRHNIIYNAHTHIHTHMKGVVNTSLIYIEKNMSQYGTIVSALECEANFLCSIPSSGELMKVYISRPLKCSDLHYGLGRCLRILHLYSNTWVTVMNSSVKAQPLRKELNSFLTVNYYEKMYTCFQ